MTERHAAQAPALRERLPQIFNSQSSIVNFQGLPPIALGFKICGVIKMINSSI